MWLAEKLSDIAEELEESIIFRGERIASKQQRLATIEGLEAEMEAGALPFLKIERCTRLARLEKTLEDPEISISEKYRKTMEV